MDIYIDKANLLSFVKSKENPLFSDCNGLLKKQLNVYFNFPKEELKSSALLMQWATTLSQGVNPNTVIKFDYKEPKRPLKSNSSNNFCINKLSSVYLLEDIETTKFKNSGCVLVGEVGEEIEVFNKLFISQNDYLFERKLRINGAEFKSWSDLEHYSLPLTDIIIVDPYITSDPSLLASNLEVLLKTIAIKANSKVNIVIYTNIDKSLPYNQISPVVRKAIKQVTSIGPKFTLVTYKDQKGQKSRAEHDRTVITNYYRIYSGDTFNYFDSTGKVITKGRELSFSSLANCENFNLSRELIKDLQKNIDFFKANNTGIEGDKSSNFLNFI
ncbi:hypothetical protein PG911_07550 [Tenacibaculum ovolyticum]|uniref:hypothetical protein n=1 Tax=Tenacibaculum ovolyticum TaxID=104270 RepID=UPI0022F3C0D4|nr:hypothetical protein [Tenacibaculum ovolyticum]WBX78101.1 hypothetical protein PG911_07550 [Tenacibaculum ovolyticum]